MDVTTRRVIVKMSKFWRLSRIVAWQAVDVALAVTGIKVSLTCRFSTLLLTKSINWKAFLFYTCVSLLCEDFIGTETSYINPAC